MTEPLELPAAIDVERSLLGAVLLSPELMSSPETETLTEDDFHLEAHRKIYAAMRDLWGESIPIETLSVVESLEKRHEVEAVGGMAYLSSLIDGVPERPSLQWYVDTLHDKATKRKLISLSQNIIVQASNGSKSADILESLQRAALRLESQTIEPAADLFVPWSKFRNHGREEVDWLVDGVIENGTNGFMLGLPKARKSLASAALAVALITGTPWLGFKTKRRRVAIISREDYAGTTARRIKQLIRGIDSDPYSDEFDEYLWLNSRAEAKHLMLTDSRCLKGVIDGLKKHRSEFLILDVLKVMHDSDENDAKEMGAVLRRVEQIRDEVGCQVCIVHHARKGEGMTLSEMMRGSTVISGFGEFLIGMQLVDEDAKVIQARFETKADNSPPALYWQVENYEPTRSIMLKRVDWEPKGKGKKYEPKALTF